jgi:acyl-CoA dehydrogenase
MNHQKGNLLTEELRLKSESMAKIAAESADAVDRDARFPSEAFAAARTLQLLGILVPPELGGQGARISDVADLCYVLGCACSSTGMIFAMHQITLVLCSRPPV